MTKKTVLILILCGLAAPINAGRSRLVNDEDSTNVQTPEDMRAEKRRIAEENEQAKIDKKKRREARKDRMDSHEYKTRHDVKARKEDRKSATTAKHDEKRRNKAEKPSRHSRGMMMNEEEMNEPEETCSRYEKSMKNFEKRADKLEAKKERLEEKIAKRDDKVERRGRFVNGDSDHWGIFDMQQHHLNHVEKEINHTHDKMKYVSDKEHRKTAEYKAGREEETKSRVFANESKIKQYNSKIDVKREEADRCRTELADLTKKIRKDYDAMSKEEYQVLVMALRDARTNNDLPTVRALEIKLCLRKSPHFMEAKARLTKANQELKDLKGQVHPLENSVEHDRNALCMPAEEPDQLVMPHAKHRRAVKERKENKE